MAIPPMRTAQLTAFLSVLACTSAGAAPASGAPGAVDFNFEILPLLSDRCFVCHGTDAAKRKKDLRLDTREGALKVIKPGDPDNSEFMQRIGTTDADEVMPPPESHLTLTDAEKALLRAWIAQGAEYKGHWSLQPVAARAVPPAVSAGETNEADRFISARLKSAGLALQPAAAPGRVLRRLSFDLIGLPPSPEELDAFEKAWAQDADAAVAAAADRLLASPHWGERMAADWLDVARFADTFGYQTDFRSPVWPWRDWVIRAFNENLPFDQFITWQLAGDLLPQPTRDQQIATAFNRLHRQTNEGGSIEEEFRVEYVCDRVETYSTAFLGLTMQCSRCHDHKYDPISQKDFYSLSAYFNNIDESGLYSFYTDAAPTPAMSLATPQQEKAMAEAALALSAEEVRAFSLRQERRAAFAEWKLTAPTAVTQWPVAGLSAHYPFDEIKGRKVANAVNAKEPGAVFEEMTTLPGKIGQGLALSGENNVNFSHGGDWTRDDAFSLALWMRTPDVKERAVIFHRSKSWTDAGSCGYELLLENGRLSAGLVHFWPGNALRVQAKEALPLNEWVHVVWSYDGSSRAAGLHLYINGAPVAVDIVRDQLTKDINRGGEKRPAIGQRNRDRGFKGGAVDDFRLYDRALTALEAQLTAGAAVTENDAARFEYYLSTVDPVWREHLAKLKALRKERSRLTDSVTELMTMREMKKPKTAHLLMRGAYDHPGEVVTPRTPSAIPALANAPANRLGLARWTVARENPLTARVTVNRLWQSFFGRGLVATPEDFGLQGALPSHPELLDFLALRFMESGWDLKALAKYIVTSGTYRQESNGPAEVRAADPDNKLLSRGPAFRLSAEQIRDQALVAAGTLDRTLGGDSVDPDKTNRRSLYTFWKRTMPDVRMELFDMAKREVCVARRTLTSSPLQALTLLNEARFNEWARQTAERAAKAAPPDSPEAVVWIFRQLTSRRPTEREQAVLRQLYTEQAASSGKEGAEAQKAALTAVAQAVLNFDECVMKR